MECGEAEQRQQKLLIFFKFYFIFKGNDSREWSQKQVMENQPTYYQTQHP